MACAHVLSRELGDPELPRLLPTESSDERFEAVKVLLPFVLTMSHAMAATRMIAMTAIFFTSSGQRQPNSYLPARKQQQARRAHCQNQSALRSDRSPLAWRK